MFNHTILEAICLKNTREFFSFMNKPEIKDDFYKKKAF